MEEKFRYASADNQQPTKTSLSSAREVGVYEIKVDSLDGWNTRNNKRVDFVMIRKNATGGEYVKGTHTSWTGIAKVDTNEIIDMQLVAGDDISYPADSDVIATTTAHWANSLVDGLLKEHNVDGSHKATDGLRELVAEMSNPVGTLKPYMGNEAQFNDDPARFGWLFMVKNREYLISEYTRLYNHLKTANSSLVVDSGATGKFKFGDAFFGRVFVGLDATQTEFNTLGKTGGAKTSTNTTDNASIPLVKAGADGSLRVVVNTSTWSHNHSVTSSTIQPYTTVSLLIKY